MGCVVLQYEGMKSNERRAIEEDNIMSYQWVWEGKIWVESIVPK